MILKYRTIRTTSLGADMTELAQDGWRFVAHLATETVVINGGFGRANQYVVLMEKKTEDS